MQFGASSGEIAAELLADRADILVVLARTLAQAEVAVRMVVDRAADRRTEVVGVSLADAQVFCGLQARPVDYLREFSSVLLQAHRAHLPLAPSGGLR